MKRTVILRIRSLGVAIAALLLAGCGENSEKKTVIHVGMLCDTVLPVQEENLKRQLERNPCDKKTELNREETRHYQLLYQSYRSISDLTLAFNSGRIDLMYIPKFSADWLLRMGWELNVIPDLFSFHYQMVVSERSPELRKNVENALSEMRRDRTTKKLISRFIDRMERGAKPPHMPGRKDSGAIRVGVTGALPPLDYVTPEGDFVGFNAAILGELGKRLKLPIQFVPVEIDSWPAAMKSGRIDMMFWLASHNKPLSDADGILFTQSFYHCPIVFAMRKDFRHPALWKEYFAPKMQHPTALPAVPEKP